MVEKTRRTQVWFGTRHASLKEEMCSRFAPLASLPLGIGARGIRFMLYFELEVPVALDRSVEVPIAPRINF